MSAVVVSEYVPVAVNCCVFPFAMLGFAGVTAMLVSVVLVYVKVAVAVVLLGFVTVIETLPLACGEGTVAVKELPSAATVPMVAAVPPMVRERPDAKPEPLKVTVVPGA